MRDAAIVEIGIRETATYCAFAEFACANLDAADTSDAARTFFFIQAFLAHCATVARLVWSAEIALHTGGQSIAELLDVPHAYHAHQDKVRTMIENYDLRLVRGLTARGEVDKLLDGNIGDRDAFEEERSVFLRHYDPSVETLTLLEEEIDLRRLRNEIADIGARAAAWLAANATLEERPAAVRFP